MGFYENTTFVVDGDAGYVPSKDQDKLWSFSTATGELLDDDGLDLPEPATASDPFPFANDRLAIPGWFPEQGIFIADVSEPSDLEEVGMIDFPDTTSIQGQNVAVDDDGTTGYVAGFPDDRLYSFDVDTSSLEDDDGLSLPGNPDRIARAGDRLAVVDTTDGRIMVADVSDPSDLELAGVIELPGSNAFGSNDDVVFADDGTGFVSSNERVLYSFDITQLELLDQDGITFGDEGLGSDIAIHGEVVACLSSKGLSFIDVSDPSHMRLISDADFDGASTVQGSATVEFSSDGGKVAAPTILPDDLVFTFDVFTGEQVADPFSVSDNPNFLTVYQPPDDRVGVISTIGEKIHLISNLLGYTNYLPIAFERK